MILVWAVGLSIGAVDPIMLLPTILYLVIAVSTFAWMGLYWSVVSRTSLIAVIRAFMAAVFMAGGFWLLLACCAVPLELMRMNLYGDRSLEMNLTQIGMGITPGFSIGWLPLHQFDDLEPFQQTHYRAEGTIGPWGDSPGHDRLGRFVLALLLDDVMELCPRELANERRHQQEATSTQKPHRGHRIIIN